MTNKETISLLKLAKVEIEWEYPLDYQLALDKAIKALEKEPKTDIIDKIKAEIEQVKVVMNEEIIEHNRKDLINFINGINQCLVIIDRYRK